MNQNNSHLIAGFFRYHREKLNYSLRGLVGDGKVVDLSSLSAFENGKKILSENQLIWLFKRIDKDYIQTGQRYYFDKEYKQIIELICLGETKTANTLFHDCLDKNVLNTLGVVNFAIIGYVLSIINNDYSVSYDFCLKCTNNLNNDQYAIIKIAQALLKMNKGLFDEMLDLLSDADKLTHNHNIKAWITFERGRGLGYSGNYVESTIALLESKTKFSELLGIIRLIQINLNLGSAYFMTNSLNKAEESYLDAYHRALLLNNSSNLLTKSFNSLCWLYLKNMQYDKLDVFVANRSDNLIQSRNTFFILAWSYYKLDNKDEAIRLCQEGMKKYSKYTYVCMVYEYIEKACKGIKTGQDALLRKIIETEDYDNTAEIKELFTYEIIDIYERRKNYEKAFKYAKKLLNR